MSESIKHPDNEPIETMPQDVFDTPKKIEFYLKQCHNTDCDHNENGFCWHGVIFTSYKCTEYYPKKMKCKFTELDCTKNQDCDNCIVFWYGYYRDIGEIKDEV